MRTSLFYTKTRLTQQISYTLGSPGELLKSRCLGNIPIKSQCQVRACMLTRFSPTLCNSMDCSLPGSSVHGDSPGKNTGVGCHALLQVIFLIQGSNPYPPALQAILYHWATGEAPRIPRECHYISSLIRWFQSAFKVENHCRIPFHPLYEFSPEKWKWNC